MKIQDTANTANIAALDPRAIAILEGMTDAEKLALMVFALEVMGISANADRRSAGFILNSELEEEMEKVGLASPDPDSDTAELDYFYDRNYRKLARLRHTAK